MTEIKVSTPFAELAKVSNTEETHTKLGSFARSEIRFCESVLTRFRSVSDSDSGKEGFKAEEEEESRLSLDTLFLNDDELTPTLSLSALRSGSTSKSSVTPLGELLTPSTATSPPVEEGKPDVRVPGPTTEMDLGDIDESRFSTVALNIRSSRQSSTISHLDSTGRRSSTASFLLAKAQDAQFRHSLDGHRELQDEFEKAHANEDDTDVAARAVDWGMPSVSSLPKHTLTCYS